jgi:acyl carrier protein
MTDNELAETGIEVLSRLLRRVCEQERMTLSPDTPLEDIPGIDSLRLLQAVALMEEHFQVEVDVVALEDLHVVADILGAISGARPMSIGSEPAAV